MSEPNDPEVRQRVEDLLDVIQAGASASGAKEYVTSYIKNAKENIFKLLVNCPADLQNLLRVWAWAVGVDKMERDLAEAIADGAEARKLMLQAPGEPGQAEEQGG